MNGPDPANGSDVVATRREFVRRMIGGVAWLPLLTGPARAKAGPDSVDEQGLFPALDEWARAGSRVAFPGAGAESRAERVAPGADVQAAVDRVAAGGGGQVWLEPGDHPLRSPLVLRSRVKLQGAGTERTRLVVLLRGAFPQGRRDVHGYSTWTTGLLAVGERHVFVEDLSVIYDPSLPPPPTLRTHREAFINNPEGRDDLYVVGIRFSGCEDCGIRRCRVVNAGSHPLMIEASRHISVDRTEVDGAHNKGGLGNGYVNITRSSHVLLSRLRVRDVRHFSLQNSDQTHPCRFNVLIDSQLEVDVNYHNGDAGHNLVQNCRIAVPTWHWWGPFAVGVAGQHQPPGPGNLVFRCDATRTFPDPSRNRREAALADRVYRIRDHFDRSQPLVADFAPAPPSRTLHPVRLG